MSHCEVCSVARVHMLTLGSDGQPIREMRRCDAMRCEYRRATTLPGRYGLGVTFVSGAVEEHQLHPQLPQRTRAGYERKNGDTEFRGCTGQMVRRCTVTYFDLPLRDTHDANGDTPTDRRTGSLRSEAITTQNTGQSET